MKAKQRLCSLFTLSLLLLLAPLSGAAQVNGRSGANLEERHISSLKDHDIPETSVEFEVTRSRIASTSAFLLPKRERKRSTFGSLAHQLLFHLEDFLQLYYPEEGGF